MTACHVIQAQKTPSLPKRQWQRPFGTKIFFALPSRCLPLSHIKEIARGSRDGNIFRSPEKRLVLAQNTVSTDKGMAEGFPDKNFSRPGHSGARLLDTVDSKSSPYFVREWRSTFGTKVFRSRSSQIRKKALY
jgi:hypothetical protein